MFTRRPRFGHPEGRPTNDFHNTKGRADGLGSGLLGVRQRFGVLRRGRFRAAVVDG